MDSRTILDLLRGKNTPPKMAKIFRGKGHVLTFYRHNGQISNQNGRVFVKSFFPFLGLKNSLYYMYLQSPSNWSVLNCLIAKYYRSIEKFSLIIYVIKEVLQAHKR